MFLLRETCHVTYGHQSVTDSSICHCNAHHLKFKPFHLTVSQKLLLHEFSTFPPYEKLHSSPCGPSMCSWIRSWVLQTFLPRCLSKPGHFVSFDHDHVGALELHCAGLEAAWDVDCSHVERFNSIMPRHDTVNSANWIPSPLLVYSLLLFIRVPWVAAKGQSVAI